MSTASLGKAGALALLCCACAAPPHPSPAVDAAPAEPPEQWTEVVSPPSAALTVNIPSCGGSLLGSDAELHCDLSGGIIIDPATVAPLKSVRLVSFDTDPTDISFLAALPSIEEVSFDSGVSADLSPLLTLPRLQRLAVLGPAPRIDTLRGLSTLKRLDLTNAEIPDLRPLTTNTNLRELVMLRTDVPDVAPIRSFTKLERLELQAPSPPNHEEAVVDPDWRRRQDSLEFLADLAQLEEAFFHDLLLEDGCRGLNSAESLRSLTLRRSGPCESFAVLSKLVGLQRADLSHSRFVDQDLIPLSSLDALESLSLTGTGVDDLMPLASLPALRSLHFVPGGKRQRRSVETLQRAKPDLEVSR